MLKRSVPVIGLAALWCGLMLGCNDESTEAEATAALCDDLQELREAIESAPSISADTTVESLREAREDIGSKVEDVQDSAAALSGVRADELRQAYDEFRNSVESLEEGQTLRSAVETIAPEFTQLVAALQGLVADIDCDSAGAGS